MMVQKSWLNLRSQTPLYQKKGRETKARGTEGVFRHRLLPALEPPEGAQPDRAVILGTMLVI